MTFEEFQFLLWLLGMLPVLVGIITMLPWNHFSDSEMTLLFGSLAALIFWPVLMPALLTFRLGLMMRRSAARRATSAGTQ